jgi:hypothetical protein
LDLPGLYAFAAQSFGLIKVKKMVSRAKTPLFAEGRTLAIEEFKYALESWQKTLAFARFPRA